MKRFLVSSVWFVCALTMSGCFFFQSIQDSQRLGLGLACDFDRAGGGVEANFMIPNVFSGFAVGPTIEYLRGNQSFDYSIEEGFEEGFKTAGDISDDLKYNVIRAAARATYPVSVSDTRPITVYPMVRPGVYRWSASDFDDTETLWTIDFGGGIAYGQVEFDIFSTLDGPDISTRLRFNIPIGRN